ncbi:hypothetical protein [Afipia sp. Root123D2]|uniref:hypothetical protein n=1 Tax=Afipia sp. Root123D2 TaxID=1736436 RepID=UPI000B126847|nr:hypothetical protein [Afipia sp. Root123D2]
MVNLQAIAALWATDSVEAETEIESPGAAFDFTTLSQIGGEKPVFPSICVL